MLPLRLVLASSPFADLNKPLPLWINGGLMALFFLLVGLEIEREAVEGDPGGDRHRLLAGRAGDAR